MPKWELRQLLIAVAQYAGIRVCDVDVMEGSRRLRHADERCIGLGVSRKIVVFDTLMEQLSPAELEAVLAHEIGRFKLNHVHI